MTYRERKGPLRGFVFGLVASAIFAACMDVPPVATATTPPEPVTESYQEPCNNFWVVPELGSQSVVYAEHAFPGLKAAEIAARVHVMANSPYAIADYVTATRIDKFQETLMIRDGAAAVVCGFQGQTPLLTIVTFVVR